MPTLALATGATPPATFESVSSSHVGLPPINITLAEAGVQDLEIESRITTGGREIRPAQFAGRSILAPDAVPPGYEVRGTILAADIGDTIHIKNPQNEVYDDGVYANTITVRTTHPGYDKPVVSRQIRYFRVTQGITSSITPTEYSQASDPLVLGLDRAGAVTQLYRGMEGRDQAERQRPSPTSRSANSFQDIPDPHNAEIAATPSSESTEQDED